MAIHRFDHQVGAPYIALLRCVGLRAKARTRYTQTVPTGLSATSSRMTSTLLPSAATAASLPGRTRCLRHLRASTGTNPARPPVHDQWLRPHAPTRAPAPFRATGALQALPTDIISREIKLGVPQAVGILHVWTASIGDILVYTRFALVVAAVAILLAFCADISTIYLARRSEA